MFPFWFAQAWALVQQECSESSPTRASPNGSVGDLAMVWLSLNGRSGPQPWFHLQTVMNSGSKPRFCSMTKVQLCRVLLPTGLLRTGSPIRHVVLQKTFNLTAVRFKWCPVSQAQICEPGRTQPKKSLTSRFVRWDSQSHVSKWTRAHPDL